MFKKFGSLLLAAAFVVLFSLSGLRLWQTVTGIALLIVLTGFTNYFVHRKSVTRFWDFTFLLLPTFWIGASAGIIFLQNSRFWEIVFIYFFGIIFLKLQLNLQPKTNSIFLENIFFFSAFGIFLGIWALDFFFTPAWWLIMALVFTSSLLLFWTGIFNTHAQLNEKIIYTLFLAFMLTQISWALLFWPLHFVSMAVVTSVLFYLAWTVVRLHFLGSLNRQRIVYHSTFALLILLITLSTAVWLPAS